MERKIDLMDTCLGLLSDAYKDKNFIKDMALYDGFGGFVYYIIQMPDRVGPEMSKQELMGILMDSVKNSGSQGLTNFTLSSGLSGLGLMINKLVKMGYFEPEEFQLNDLIFQDALEEIKRENIDLLHGAMGQLYYLNEVGYLGQMEVSRIVDALMAVRIEDELGIRFNNQTVREWQQTDNINLSLSHGQIGAGLVLLDIYSSSEDPMIAKILAGMVDYMLSHLVISENHSLFPLLVDPELDREELIRQEYYRENYSWCYGDLGALIFLLRYCTKFPDHRVSSLIQLMSDNLHGRMSKIGFEDLNMNSHLCHGSAGILLGLKELNSLDGYNNWFSLMDRFYDFTMQLLAKDIADQNFMKKKSSKTILEGIPGSLMAILDYEGNMDPQWKSIFLLREG